jgi:hypothetical protein
MECLWHYAVRSVFYYRLMDILTHGVLRLRMQPSIRFDVAGVRAVKKQENFMSNRLIPLSVAILLATGAALASAADSLNLTAAQKQQIASDIGSQIGEKAPASFHAAVGSKVPSSLSLHPLPTKVSTDVSSVKSYEYVKLENNQILLVNPSDRMVVAVIEASSTTTGSGGKMSPKK